MVILLSSTYIIDEYKKCKTTFSISKQNFLQFLKFCKQRDKKKIKKLIIEPETPNEDGFTDVSITATSYVGIFNILDRNKSTLIVKPKIGSTAFIQMLHYVDKQNIIIQNLLSHG